jgi:hypothetical protein
MGAVNSDSSGDAEHAGPAGLHQAPGVDQAGDVRGDPRVRAADAGCGGHQVRGGDSGAAGEHQLLEDGVDDGGGALRGGVSGVVLGEVVPEEAE